MESVPGTPFIQLTIDCCDAERLTTFWSAALGWQRTPPEQPDAVWWDYYRRRLGDRSEYADRLFDPEGLRPPLWFQQVPEPKSGKNRLHLDLYPGGRDPDLSPADRRRLVEQKVAELLALGATLAAPPEIGEEFVVLHDPEGNEFCVS